MAPYMTDASARTRLNLILCLALALITFALYSPALHHEFLVFDDQQYVTENPHVLGGLSGQGLVWAFKSGYASNWHPLTWISHQLDCQVFGLNSRGHHLTNVLFHVANTVLLFGLLYRLSLRTWCSACVAALFAWHPLHVESVAWLAERKDVLSTFFWLSALLAYVGYARNRGAGGYLFTLGLFALGLMSKPMVVTLPFVLLLLDYWPLLRSCPRTGAEVSVTTGCPARPWSSLVWEKVPFLILSVLASAVTIWAQRESHAMVSIQGLPLQSRLLHVVLAYGHYLQAMLFPVHLSVFYPYQTLLAPMRLVGAATVLITITAVVVRWRKERPHLLVGWFWFLGTLVPVIGLVQVGDQAWADRYTYIPLIGPFIMMVWELAKLVEKTDAPKLTHVALAGMVMTVVGSACIGLTTNQLGCWQNTRTLFEQAVRVDPRNAKALSVLGSLLAQEGKLDEAIAQCRLALQYQPGCAEAHFFLGNALDRQGKLDEAIAEYQRALWFKPTQEQTHLLIGIAEFKQKRYPEAAAQYAEVLRANPDSAAAHNNLAKLLHVQGRFDDAIQEYTAAIRFDPRLAPAHNNLGILQLEQGKVAEGVARLREALRLDPGNEETKINLALALNQQHEWAEAEKLLGPLSAGRPGDANLHFQLGLSLAWQDRSREAMSQYASALLLNPDYPEALDRLAWILATSPKAELRNGTEALRMAAHACELTTRKSVRMLETLAAAYAECGKFSEAEDALQEALNLLTKNQTRASAEEALGRELLAKVQAGHPFREPRH